MTNKNNKDENNNIPLVNLISTRLLLAICLLLPSVSYTQPSVRLGNEVLIESQLQLLKGKQVGLVINHTSRVSGGEYLVDELLRKGIDVVAMFSPEHGIRGDAAAGEKVSDGKDEKTGIKVFSLYGKTRKPSPEMLANIDVLVYDIQDVGARFYTYISTMGLCMEAAAEQGIPFIVLDRPNPLGGNNVDGPLLEDSQRSFVGMYPIPIVYGLTCGELAKMIYGERWLKGLESLELNVVPMVGWERSMIWKDTGLSWIPPSPNIRTPEAALIYPSTCLIEATNLSEGRGTERPFQIIGAPYIDSGAQLSDQLNALGTPSLKFEPVVFIPTTSKFSGEECRGVQIFLDTSASEPIGFSLGMQLINIVAKKHPKDFQLTKASLIRLLGSEVIFSRFEGGMPNSEILQDLGIELDSFRRKSVKYRLYD